MIFVFASPSGDILVAKSIPIGHFSNYSDIFLHNSPLASNFSLQHVTMASPRSFRGENINKISF